MAKRKYFVSYFCVINDMFRANIFLWLDVSIFKRRFELVKSKVSYILIPMYSTQEISTNVMVWKLK